MIIGSLFRSCLSTSMNVYPSPALTVSDRLRVELPQSSLPLNALPYPPSPHPQFQHDLESSMALLSLRHRRDLPVPLPHLSQSPPPPTGRSAPSSGRKGHLERMKGSSPYQQCKPSRKETHKKMWAQFQIRQYLDIVRATLTLDSQCLIQVSASNWRSEGILWGSRLEIHPLLHTVKRACFR